MKQRAKRILLVDIDPEVLLPLEAALEAGGFNTTVTWDARDASALLREHRFDLVVVGHHPPEVDAESLLRDVAEQKCDCIVLRSAAHYPFEAEYLEWLGASAVLPRRGADAVQWIRQAFPPALRPTNVTTLARAS